MKTGSIIRRGKSSWRVKLDAGHDANGKRKFHVETIRGTKADAVAVLAKRIAERSEGQLIERSTLTVADYARHWLAAIAPAKASGRTIERYGELIRLHIAPALGTVEIQKLDGSRIDAFYARLATAGRIDGKGGLSPQTCRHIHRLLSQILGSAVKAGKLRTSPMAAVQTAPKVKRSDVQVLDNDELTKLFAYLQSKPLYMPVLLGASTGLRRSEVLGLRWSDIDTDKATLTVAKWSSSSVGR